jgi:heme-degrading monooxygenase HmoA
MSVYVTIRVTVDPTEFEKRAAEYSEVIDRIMAIARAKGVIGHRWFRGDGEIMSVDEWPDEESFRDFFHTAGHEIGPFLNMCGVTVAPEVKVWGQVDVHDAHGWGA